jgi:hypothetical protein
LLLRDDGKGVAAEDCHDGQGVGSTRPTYLSFQL